MYRYLYLLIMHMKEEKIQGDSVMECEKEESACYEEEVLCELAGQADEWARQDYFGQQGDLRVHMRGVLLQWLIEVQQKYRLQSSTYFLTVAIVDLYLSKCAIGRAQLQLVGVSALWVAAKYEEVYHVPALDSLVLLCDSAYSAQDILLMESSILAQMHFRFAPTPSLFFEALAPLAALSPKDTLLARYLLEATTFELAFNAYDRPTLAFAIVFFIKKIRGLPLSSAERRLHQKYALDERTVKGCIRDVCSLWQNIDFIDCMASLKNKYLAKKYMEVARIRMCEKTK